MQRVKSVTKIRLGECYDKIQCQDIKGVIMSEVMEWRSKKEFDNLSERVNILQTDLANFVGAILQAGIVELVKDEQGDLIYKINKVVILDESVQQD